MKKQLLTKLLFAVAMLGLGTNAWANPIETVGTEGSGDAWASRKFSSAYELALGETYHFTFVNHNYSATTRWYNWLLDCVNSSAKDANGFPTGTYYFTLRSDVYGWGDSYSATDNVSNYNTANDWADYCSMMDGATVDMYVNYSSDDKKIRTYVNITGSDSKKYYFNNTSAAIDASSVFLFLLEEMAYLEITTAEKSSTYKNYVYSREATASCNDTWAASDIVTTETAGKWLTSTSGDGNRGLFIVADKGLMTRTRGNTNIDTGTLLLSRAANSIVTFDAIWNVGDSDNKGNHQQGYGQYCSIQYGDLLIKCCLDTRSTDYTYTINGKKTSLGASAGSLLNTDLTIHLVVNSSTNEISEFYIKNGATTLAQFSDLTALNNTFAPGTNYDKVITKADISGISSTNDFNYLKSITIQQETQAVATADVTFKYEDTAGNSLSTVKADQILSDVAQGTTISDLITSTYTATFFNGTSNKYIYADSYTVEGDYTTVQAGGNTVTLKFTDYPSTAYAVKAQVSSVDLTTLASGSAYFDGSTTEYWSKYINVDDAWYVTTTYGQVITAGAYNIPFTATSLDYFFECENMTYSSTFNTYNGTDVSNGVAKTLYAAANAKTTSTVAAGVYTITLGGKVWENGYTDTYEIAYSVDGTNWVPVGNIVFGSGEEGEKNLESIIIPTASYIRVRATMGSQTPRRYLDYMTLLKTADLPSSVSGTITAAGWSTFASPYALNLSTITGGTAYYAYAASGSTVKLTQTTATVPAGEGIMVKGTAGETFTIGVAASGTAISGNLLKGQTTTGNVAASTDGTYHYVFGFATDNPTTTYGFYNLASATEVAAGKAYLETTTALTAGARLAIVFEDESTGIGAIAKSQEPNANSYYDLQGRRVAQPTKGLYIKDGKKVIVK